MYAELTSIPLLRKELLSIRRSDFINIYITSRPPAPPSFHTLSNSLCEFSKTALNDIYKVLNVELVPPNKDKND